MLHPLSLNLFMKETQDKLDIVVKPGRGLSQAEYLEILTMCNKAYGCDVSPIIRSFENPTHILGRYRGRLVSHTLWITRWLRIGEGSLLCTAYIEATATDLDHRHRGFASEIMNRAASEIHAYDIAALSTGSPGFYARLGWRLWEGPLYYRKDEKMIPTPEEQGCVMVYILPRSTTFDINAPLSIEWRTLEPW